MDLMDPAALAYLEDLGSGETAAWVAAHARRGSGVDLDDPDIAKFEAALSAVTNVVTTTTPVLVAEKLWWFDQRAADEDRFRSFVLDRAGAFVEFPEDFETWKGPPPGSRVLFDDVARFGAAAAATDKTCDYEFNRQGTLCAYQISRKGLSWSEIHVLDVATGKDLPDVIPHVRNCGVEWLPDGSGFLYATPQWSPDIVEGSMAPSEFMRVYAHVLGTPADQDTLVVHMSEPAMRTWGPALLFSDPHFGATKPYSFLYAYAGCSKGNSLWIMPGYSAPLGMGSVSYEESHEESREESCEEPSKRAPLPLLCTAPVPVLTGFEHTLTADFCTRNYMYSLTDIKAPRNRIVAVDLDNADDMEPEGGGVVGGTCRRLHELLSEPCDPTCVMKSATFMTYGAVTYVFVVYCTAAVSTRVALYELVAPPAGTPGPGTLVEVIHALVVPSECVAISISRSNFHPKVLVTTSGLYSPGTRYLLDVSDFTLKQLPQKTLPGLLPPEAFETRVLATDTRVPVLVFGKRVDDNPLAAPTRPRPMVLYGYGGFSINVAPPAFSASVVLTMQGLAFASADDPPLYAIACIRGGKELGTQWADEGRLRNKHRCFEDFKGASDLCVATGLTARSMLGIRGKSNGGLLVLTCATKWPGMAAAVWAAVPLADMLRFHDTGGGRHWVVEYGNPEDPDDAEYLKSYSPVHNVRPGVAYPRIVCETSETDDNVAPWHAYKMVAALEAVGAPVQLVLTPKTGHGFAPGKAFANHIAARDAVLFARMIVETC